MGVGSLQRHKGVLGYFAPLIPIATFGLLFKSFSPRPFWDQLVRAAVIWGFLLVVLIEGLSLFRGLTTLNLSIGWGIAFLVAIAVCFIRRPVDWRGSWLRLPRPRWSLWAIALTVALPTLLLSLIALPNTWDALTYHLSRVDHWIQNRSVEYYPLGDSISRENELQPLAEYVILNFQLLGRTDAFANLVQWSAMAGSLSCVYAIARLLGASEGGAVFALLFAATLPIGVLEASSTQNDYVVSFWLLAKTSCWSHFVRPT